MPGSYHNNALTNTLIAVNAGPCELEFYEFSGISASDSFVQFFDAAATGDVTLGTTVPKRSVLVPAGDATLRGGVSVPLPSPVEFDTGIVIAATTTPGGSTAPASALNANIDFT